MDVRKHKTGDILTSRGRNKDFAYKPRVNEIVYIIRKRRMNKNLSMKREFERGRQ